MTQVFIPVTDVAVMVREAVRSHSMNTARTQQSVARLIGPSEIGGCRAYLARVIADVPFDEMDDVKWAAFIGTALGERLELALAEAYPAQVRTQVPVEATLKSGLRVAGNADVVDVGNDRVIDFKSVDGVESIRTTGPSFKQVAQITCYLLGLVQAGVLTKDATWALVYVDRSGRDDVPVVYEGTLADDVIDQIDARLEDVLYAVEYDIDSAPRDEPHDWCMKVCPMYSHCRGKDEHMVSGLITNEEQLQAVKLYKEGQERKKSGERLMDESKQTLTGVSGSTGEYELSWTHVPETSIKAFVRGAYDRITLKPVKRLTGK